MKWVRRVSYGLLALVAAAALYIVPTVWMTPWRLQDFYLRVLLEALLDDPLLLTQLRMLESVGLTFHADDLPDQTAALRERRAQRADRQLEILESWNRDELPPEERLSFDVMHWMLETGAVAAGKYTNHPYAVDQLQGLHVRFPDVMVNYHRIDAVSDAEDYIARVAKIGPALDDLGAFAEAQEQKGFTIPRFILEKIAVDARKFAAQSENALAVDFKAKVSALSASEAKKKVLLSAFDEALEKAGLPGYFRFAAKMDDLALRAPQSAGVGHLADGAGYYASRIRENTSTQMSAEEIHRIGLSEVERIQNEMSSILDAESIATSTSTFGDRMRELATDARWYFEDSAEGRAELLAGYRTIIEAIEARLHEMFRNHAKAPLDVMAVPKFKEQTAPFAYYFPAAMDGTKPGTFFANLRDVKEHKRFGMRTLAYHEAVPGHHFQLSIARAQKTLPVFRQLIPLNAYSEGWALYAEQLAAEHGFQADPFDRLGYLDAQLFRAIRLVVDTGLHAKDWSREGAIQYMLDNGGMQKSEVVTEVERYCVWPGQALGYMVGRLEFLELRARAKQALGARFDLRAFHDVVLVQGALPLELLEREVDQWVATERAAVGAPADERTRPSGRVR